MLDFPSPLRDKRKMALIVLALLVVSTVIALKQGAPSPVRDSYSYARPGASGLGAPAFYAEEMAAGKAVGRAVAPIAADQVMPPDPTPQPTAGETAAEVDQRIIKNGQLALVVEKVSEAVTRIAGLATAKGGFVQSSSVLERGDGTYSGQISIRVPAQEFEASMEAVKGFATLVKSETSSGQDVTERYTDLQAQLRNAKAQEETYLEVLKQARTVEDILAVQERLGSIRSVIESLEGRLKYLENVTEYSTISVSLEEEPAVRIPTKEFRPAAIIKEAARALVAIAQDLIAGLIWVAIVWGGILAPIGLLGWLGWKVWKWRVR